MSSSSGAKDDTGNDELVSSFMAFTSCSDPARAASYLEMSGGDLQTAVGLYMEHEQGGGGGSSGGGASSSASGGGFGRDGGGGFGPMLGDFDVRAPDETRTMRLMDDQMMAADPTLQLMNAMMEEQLARTAFSSLSDHQDRSRFDARAAVNAAAADAGNDSDNEDFHYDDDDDEDDEVQILPSAGSSAAPPPAPRLNDIFAAPIHLMHKAGGFNGARAAAKDSKRWLLVNIQRDAEFSSHALNRDVWRDELVENLIREGFIFWQAMDLSPDGRTFVERYQVNDYPHISIIDPRTGRLLWRKEGWTQQNPVTAATFAEMAMDFCSRNSFDRPPQAPRPPGGGGTAGSASGFRPPQKRPVQEMTEDEQLQEAMRASLQESSSPPVQGRSGDDEGDDDDDDIQEVDSPMNGSTDDSKASPEATKKATNSLIEELLALRVDDEPSAGSRLAIRMPDGKRVVRKFAPTDKVKTVYAFFAQSSDEVRGGRDFTLMAGFPPSDLILDLDRSVDECKLSGQQITVRWKEE